ncbi:hypothetical protein NON19_28595 [Streptomyces rubrisoli]|uniref:Uncharacterized protein n=1 Tax=Streptantibioticus rubrisoli TaxID=1387313 RepID=A0ABT1PKK3_9ACTN|nr:hypothetical protein [Streptantibioticus rubrisoli]
MITVKTYPELSKKYRETSCVAGVRLDQDAPQHVRIFPVPYRLMEHDSQFKKYAVIEVDVRRHDADRRPESLRPNLNTLKVVDHLPSSDGWRRRLEHIQPLIDPSLCAIKRAQERNGTSLGVFRPAEISDFRLKPADPWTDAQIGIANQVDVIDQDRAPLEWVPYEFRYRFRCSDKECTGHDMALKDWEAGQSYRNFERRYPATQLQAKLRERWFGTMLDAKRAVHFFVGNIAAHPKTFMLLGLFYPPAEVLTEPVQTSLF